MVQVVRGHGTSQGFEVAVAGRVQDGGQLACAGLDLHVVRSAAPDTCLAPGPRQLPPEAPISLRGRGLVLQGAVVRRAEMLNWLGCGPVDPTMMSPVRQPGSRGADRRLVAAGGAVRGRQRSRSALLRGEVTTVRRSVATP